ncbi:MAG: 3,5-cyclic-AMP phosphodiesterase [Microbacteriaceae bacterium]|nr:3,5-cyclic-AMP phosphodiesterase [Microbacteriaceae bacterium]
MSVQMGQYPEPGHVVVHMSDTHFLAEGARLYGRVDTDSTLGRAMRQLKRSGIHPDAIVLTGDIADRGEADAYGRVRALVEPLADQLEAELVWVMGNHDERGGFRAGLLDESPSSAPVDRVVVVNGLRIIALDSSVPGFHHGALDDGQLDWLRSELSEPAPHGTILALHHPPIPTALPLMTILELQQQDRLAEVLAGSDVRAILGGHLHYATTGSFAGIPVSVAAATCYTMDLSAPTRQLEGIAGGQSFNLIHVHADQLVHSVIPITDAEVVTRFDDAFLTRMEGLDREGRIEAFSRFVAPA